MGAFWPPSTTAALAALHDDIIEQVLGSLTAEELLQAALVCSRLKQISYHDSHWERLFLERWGEAGPLLPEARRLCGSWRGLYSSKARAEAEAAPWRRPCQWELEAALGAMVASAPISAAPQLQGNGGGEAAEGDAVEGPSPCHPALAVCFLVDGSGSVGEDDFCSMTSFIVTATTSFTERVPGAQVCVLQFSNAVRVELPLAAVEDGPAFAESVSKMVRMNGGTNIAAALAQAGSVLKAAGPCAARLVVLLTDGRVDGYQSREAKAMASRLADEQAGVTIWALGVGRGVDRQELVKILEGVGGTPADDRYIDLCVRDDPPW